MMALSGAGLLGLAALPFAGHGAAWLLAPVFAVLLLTAWKLQQALLGPLTAASDMCKKLSAGDLGQAVRAGSDDEMGWLIGNLNTMQKSLSSVVRQVFAGTASVELAAREIDAGNNALSRQTSQQAATLEEAAATMEQLTGTIRQNADGAALATRLAGETTAVAQRGSAAVRQLVERIDGMAVSAAQMSAFIEVIDGVAFQTNVLALNAAVEAARAGEQGRGFAVVAAEVRNLAQRSANASKEISALIRASAGEIAQAGELGAGAARTMAEIVLAAKAVSDLGGQIAAASVEQTSGVEQLNEAVAHMDQATQRNAAFVEQLSATAAALAGQSGALKSSVDVFYFS